MQLCDGRPLEEYWEDMQQVYTKLTQQDAIIFGMPVYQYSMSGVLKNFLDICGGALQSKQIGVIVNAGWPNCYMASQDLFNALQFEYETTNIMPIPYSCSADFKDGEVVNKKVLDKLYALAEKLISL